MNALFISKVKFPMLIGFIFFGLVLSGCGGVKTDPVEKIKAALASEADYSLILDDMKEEGNFFKHYFHKYKIVRPDAGEQKTDWIEVPESSYKKYFPLLGMTIAGKTDGKDLPAAAPPGYSYVGNPRYGHWREGPRGGTFWEFYGKYALLRDLVGGTIYRGDWDSYYRYRNRRAPYFGRNNQYGTTGSWTKRTKPDFFQRYQARQKTRKMSFAQKVNSRIGRSRSGFRGRSGGRGK